MRCLICSIVLFCLNAGPASAQWRPDRGRGGTELEGFAGLLWAEEPAFTSNETGFRFDRDEDLLFGGRLGYTFPFNLFVLGEVGYSPLTMIVEGGERINVSTLLYGGALGYNLQIGNAAQIFALGGAGVARWDPDGLPQESQLRWVFGGGTRLFFTPNLALRVEVRDHIIPATLTEVRRQLSPGVPVQDELTHNLEVSGGISLFFGGPRVPDSDGDGVIDPQDACPATPRSVAVDIRGCAPDGDADEVPDHADRCPNTRPGSSVDLDGCALDRDVDGVPDGIDRCPNTPAGATVRDDGCPVDSDGDAVPDGLDRCPNTIVGATVDEEGCAVDGDGDGVPDGLDRCPGTPSGKEVDETGCSRIEAGLEAGRLILKNVYFEFGKATLKPESRPLLDEVAAALAARPDLRIEIQGHTDSVGSTEYNQRLSMQRAQAVLDYLLTYPELERGRFIVRGYGEGAPIAPNDTPEGRQENRRVELVVLNPGTGP